MMTLFISNFVDVEEPAAWLYVAAIEAITFDVFIVMLILSGLQK